MDARQKQNYDSVSSIEDREELLSSTEVEDESMAGDEEKLWGMPGRRPKAKGLVSKIKDNQWLICAGLQLVVIAMLALLLVRDTPAPVPVPVLQVGTEAVENGVTMPLKVQKFDADRSFVPVNASEMLSEELLDQWKTLLPVGAGWGKKDTFYTTTMTHQLHCIFMMARIYAGLTTNDARGLDPDYDSHYLHCIDYLRQGVMCSGDLALELHQPTDANDNGPGDGSWSGIHVCKDYSHMKSYLAEQIVDGVRVVLPIDD
ncbi:hypothetical protein BX600DRAFT_318544 [Xylariales sp. PMI_506]|nr:hypothetical protein BX600DRAFT_318544 [Xylariales sp. PMI_506]